MERRVQQDLRWVRPVGKTLVAIGVVMAVLLVCVIGRVCVYPMTSWGEMAIANHLDEVSGGQLEIVVPAERGIRASDMSPYGKWLMWGGRNESGKGINLLINMETGEEFDIDHFNRGDMKGYDYQWLPNDQLIVHNGDNYQLLKLPTMEITLVFNVIDEEKSIEEIINIFEPLQNVYAIKGFSTTGSAIALISLDTSTPIVVSGLSSKDIEQMPFSIEIIEEFYNRNINYVSPNGKWEVKIESKMLADLYVYDTAGNVVAYVKQGGRTASFLGWSPDNKAVYFKFQVGGASGGIMHPYEPVFKLVLDPALAP